MPCVMMNPVTPIPKTISNLVAWYSAQDSSTIDGTNFIWKDKSGNANNATATSSTYPTLTANALNGHTAFLFNGSSSFFNWDGTPLIGTNYTVIVIEARNTINILNYFISGANTSTTNGGLILGFKTNTSIFFSQFNNDYTLSGIAGYTSPIPRNHIFRFSSSVGKDYHLNGVLQTMTSGGSSFNATQGLIAYPSAFIGHHGIVNYFHGYIGEILIYNKYLSDAEMAQIQSYINNKWGF